MTNKSITLHATIERSLARLPNPSEILKEKQAAIDIFHKVGKQPDIFSSVQNYRDSLSAMEILTDTPFFKDYLEQIDLRSLVRGFLSAREYGYAVLECTQYDTFQGRAVPTKIELCPPELFGFDSDRQLRFYHRKNGHGDTVQKKYPNKFILVQNEPTLTNPYGIGLLDIAYWLAVGLSGNYEFMMVFAEEDGRDKWVGTYPQDATEAQKTQLMEALVKLRNGGATIKPEGMSIEPKDLNTRTSSGELYAQINEMILRKINRLWFGTDLLMQVEGKGGYSSANAGIEIKEDALNAGKHLIKQGLQSLFNIVNGLAGQSPQLVSISISRPKSLNKEAAEIDQIYGQLGMTPTKELLLKRGYEDSDFVLSEKPTPSSDFAADDDSLDDIFDIFSKKKD